MTLKTMITASAVALTVATGAMADSNFSGGYVGGNFGYGFGTVQVDSNAAAAANQTTSNMGVSGFVGGVHTGYQHQFGMFVAGAEGSFNLSNTDVKDKTARSTTTLKRKNAFGLAARLGLALNSWMAYTKLGWENAKFSAQQTSAPARASDFQKNKRLNAFVAGLGVETVVADHMMVGAEWTTSFYKKAKFTAGANQPTLKTRIGDFKVRLGYKF